MIPCVVRLPLLLLAAVSACTAGDPAAPADNAPTVDVVAAALARTADSLLQAGNVTASVPFGDAGSTLASLRRGATVRVTEGGITTEYQAVAQRYVVTTDACVNHDSTSRVWAWYPIGCTLTQRPVLLLWKGSAPDEVIEISAAPGVSRVGETWFGLIAGGAPYRPTGSVLWERAARRAWVATAGSVTIGESSAGAPCAKPPRLPPGVVGTCATGTQRAAFDLTYISTDSTRDGSAARPTRRLTLATTDIPLVQVTITNPGSRLPLVPDSGIRPPIGLPPIGLPPNPTPPDTGAHPPVPTDTGQRPVPLPPIPTLPHPPVDSSHAPGRPPDSAHPKLPPPPPVAAPQLVGRVDARRERGVVKLSFTVINLSPDSVETHFSSGQEFEFQVRSGETTLWTWSATRLFTAALHSVTWRSGQSRVFTAEWSDPGVPSGPMVAVARLTSSNRLVESVAPVVVIP